MRYFLCAVRCVCAIAAGCRPAVPVSLGHGCSTGAALWQIYHTAVGFRQRECRAFREDCRCPPARPGRLVVGRTIAPQGLGRSAAPRQAYDGAAWLCAGWHRSARAGGHHNVDRCRFRSGGLASEPARRRRTIAPQGSPVQIVDDSEDLLIGRRCGVAGA